MIILSAKLKIEDSVIAAIMCELVFRNRIAGSEDLTFAAWPAVVCSQFVQALSIITACIPYLKPFFVSLESGMIRTDDSRRLGARSIWTYGYRRTKDPHEGSSGTVLTSIGSKRFKTWTDGPPYGEATDRAAPTDVRRHNTRISQTESQTSQSRIIPSIKV